MNLSKTQKEIVDLKEGNISVIATAGSGKTTVLVNRIEQLITKNKVEPSFILAITFSRKAKENIYTRLKNSKNIFTETANKVNIETFHSFALKIIQNKYSKKYSIWTSNIEKEKRIHAILNILDLEKNPKPELFYEILDFFTFQKNNLIHAGENLIPTDNMPYDIDTMQKIYVRYEDYKESKKLIELDDFLLMANDILEDDQCILEYVKSKAKYILTDEFQDISLSQYLLLNKINKDNIMIVGDPLQAIYGFRYGDNRFILNFDKKYSNTKVINLNMNYRCNKSIVDTSNEFAKTMSSDSKHSSYTKTIPYTLRENKPVVTIFKDFEDEARNIALTIKNGFLDDDVAILARTNSQLYLLQSYLARLNIPFSVVDGINFFECPEIKLILYYLRLANNKDDDEAFINIYNKPNRWLSRDFIIDLKELSQVHKKSLYNSLPQFKKLHWRFINGITDLNEIISSLDIGRFNNLAEQISYLRKKLDLDNYYKSFSKEQYNENISNIDNFEKMCDKYNNIDELLDDIEKINVANKSNENTSVKLYTIHKAKGLEFNTVFLIGCSGNIMPHFNNEDSDEERLMYVAITRAINNLFISCVEYGFRNTYLGISPFIEKLGNTVTIINKNERSDLE